MIDRLIDIADAAARLSVRQKNLVVEQDGQETLRAPLAEVAALVVSHPAVTYSHSVLAGLMAEGAAIIICNEKRLPAGLMLPVEGHHLHAERLERQIAASAPMRKRIWRQVVQAKIAAQGRLLAELRGQDCGLAAMAARVKSGDTGNLESIAARRYWQALWEDPSFRRGRDKGGANLLLNYGYAVLRAIVGRAIVAAGLHPSIGIYHHNRYDPFRLADDLMEPFRPIVDKAAVLYTQAHEVPESLDRAARAFLIEALLRRFPVEGEERGLFDIASRCASSLAQVFEGSREQLVLPEL
jgi:CRISPR-associated protein Cas1